MFAIFVVSTLLSASQLGWIPVFLSALFWCAAIVNARSRFKWGNSRIVSGLHGIIAAMLLGGSCTAACGCWANGSIVGLLYAFAGMSIGLVAGMIPVMLLGTIPEPKTRYLGEKNERHDSGFASIVAYIAAGG